MANDINIRVLLQFLADEARREITATGSDLKGLGGAAEDAGRKSTTAGQALDQAGAASRGAATGLAATATAMASTVTAGANLEAQMGRATLSTASTRDAVTGLASAAAAAAQPTSGLTTALSGQQAAMAGAASEAANLEATMGRSALATAGARDAVTGLGAAHAAALPSLTSFAAVVSRQQTALQGALTATSGFTASIGDQASALLQNQRATAAWQAELDGVRGRFNPLFAASKQYELQLREISEAERMGAITANEAAAARDRAAQALAPMPTTVNQFSAATQQASGHSANLFAQWNDIAVMMAAGQNPMQLALQQGTQVSQVLMQMGGGMTALRAVGSSFLAMLNPISLATIGIIAFGAAGVKWLSDLSEETASFDDQIEALNTTLGRMETNLGLIRDIRLDERFGYMSASVRGLAAGMLELDRASELKNLGEIVGAFSDQASEPTFLQDSLLGIGVGAAPFTGMTTDEYLKNTGARRNNYSELGAANTYDDLKTRTDEIAELAKSGDVDTVVAELFALQQAMTGGGAVTGLKKELQALLVELTKTGIETARFEAMWNGSARASEIETQIDAMVRGYGEQMQLSQAMLQHGENSARVEEVRAEHARAALDLKLEEMGVERDSAEAVRARAALEEQIAADRDLAADRRVTDQAEFMAGLDRQIELSDAILRYGETSAEVEALRAEHAQEVLEARLLEKGWLPEIVAEAMKLNELEMERARAVRESAAARNANDQIAQLQAEAEINRAIVAYGQDSLQVKTLQIAAERQQLEQSLATMQVSEELKEQWRAAWEAARGIAAADPFGALAASGQYLRDQQERIEKLRLEQQLLGQTEEVRSRILALWEAERQIRDMGIDGTSARAAELRDAALQEAELTRELERQRDAWGSVENAASTAIENIVDRLKSGDIEGALEAVASEFTGLITELAVVNPLKNAVLGSDLGTMQDVGGLQGIWDRLTGKTEEDAALGIAGVGQSVGAMTVSAANVTINATGLSFGAMTQMPGVAANLGNAPGTSGEVLQLLQSVSTGGATRPDALTGLDAGFANPLASMIGDAQSLFGPEAVRISSAYRSPERQQQLWDEALAKYGSADAARKWVAPPGSSQHNFGRAADLQYGSPQVQDWFHSNARNYGLNYRMGHEPWHIEPANMAPGMTGATPMMAPLAGAEQAISKFGAAASTATTDLGALGEGATGIGSLLSSIGSGMAGGGGGGNLMWTVASGIAGAMGIPGFAAGGNHQGGLRIVGEKGPELEFTGPSTILPSDLTRSLLASRAPTINVNQSGGDGFAGPIPVVVNNYSGQEVQSEIQPDGRGGRQMIMTVGQQGAAAIRQPGNPMNTQLKRMGVKSGPVRR
jgi:hypothetical protein